MLSVAAPVLAAPADKANVDELLRKADQAVLEGKLNVGRAGYERALAAGADLATDYTRARNLGMVYMNGSPRDYKKAARWLEIAWKLRPGADDTRLLLAQALAWSGNHEAAIVHFRALSKASPDTAEYTTGLANVLYWAGKNDEAFAVYDRYLERRPTNLAMRLEYARVLSFARKLPEATQQYQNVLQADPNNVQAQVGLAKIASWQDDFKGALDRYNKVLKRHPNLYDAVVGKAYTIYWMGGRDQEAAALFQQALQRNPNDKEVRATLKEMGAGGVGKKTESAAAQPEQKPQPKPEQKPVQAPPVEAATLQPDTFDTHQKPEARNATTVMMEQAQAAADASNYVEAVHLYHEVLAKEPQNTKAMMQIARVLSWSRNFAESAREYDQLLQADPENMQARLERARVLSWGQNYEASVDEYNRLIKQAEVAKAQPQPKPVVQAKPVEQPPKPVPPVETARTPAPVERAAPEMVEPPATLIDVSQTRLELARVLAWSKRYGESLAQFNVILPPQQKPEAKDKPILIEKARVLSYARNYEEAVKTYDVALALDPADIEARLGKGQTLYWWGRLDQSANTLRPLMQVQALSPETKNTTAFTLASVEHGRGQNSAALNMLNAAAPNDAEAKELRHNIRQEMRPVLRFAWGWEDDEEVATLPAPSSVTRALRYSTSLAFNVKPDLRMTVSNTVTRGTTSSGLLGQYGTAALAYETEVQLNWRVNPWLQLVVGAGEGGIGSGSTCIIPCFSGPTGERTHQFVYDVHPVITKDGWRLEFAAGRHIADYTPLAVHNNVMRNRYEANVTYNWRNRVAFGGEYWHNDYSLESPQLVPPLARNDFSTSGNGGAVFITPTWYRGEHLTIDSGVRWEAFKYDSGAVPMAQAIGSGGFFTPSEYERISVNGRMVWEQNRYRLDMHGTFGPQRITGFAALLPPPPDWGVTGSVGAELSLNFGRFHPFLAYDWFSTATPAFAGQIKGAYKSHSLVAGFAYRF